MADGECVEPKGAAGPEHEIEVTPAMIEAGVNELFGFSITEPSELEMREAVKAVYTIMESRRLLDRANRVSTFETCRPGDGNE